ncbi:MAG: 2-oxo-4-hydroxy-4-carboxy-5-ureidoimidazoline decarboxylase [Ginsengibacter sp.]|jgi:2-oxo-4-hydroxy-4-carboxy-5-ureidoimidazoline decarboxylase
MTIAEFDHLDIKKKKELLFNCCGCNAWVKGMLEIFPVNDLIDLLEYAEEKWYDCNPAEWLEAFEHHPKIGDIDSIQKKFAETADYAENEQAGVSPNDKKILEELIKANEEYEDVFGYIFIVFATGKTAAEMLAILNERLLNNPHDELIVAAGEQDKITKLRLQKLFA